MAITGAAGVGRRRRSASRSRTFSPAATRRSASSPRSPRASGRAAAAHVETDLFSATLASLINVAQSALLTGTEAERHGNAHAQIVPYRMFEASDGEFVLGVGTDRQFERLAALVGRPEWAESDPLPRPTTARVGNRAALETELSAIFRGDTREAWVARCRAAGIPAGPVRGPLEALRSETARALEARASRARGRRLRRLAHPRRRRRAGASSSRRPSTPTASASGASSPARLTPNGAGQSVGATGLGCREAAPSPCRHAIAAEHDRAARRSSTRLGRSPRKRNTQIGLAIGSSIPMSDASVAVTCLRPLRRRARTRSRSGRRRGRRGRRAERGDSREIAARRTAAGARAARTLP